MQRQLIYTVVDPTNGSPCNHPRLVPKRRCAYFISLYSSTPRLLLPSQCEVRSPSRGEDGW